jgi:hypothetical protein
MMPSIITPLSSLCSPDGSYACRLGAIVVDASGRKLGLTARHVLFQMPEEAICDAASRAKVGTKIAWPTSQPGSRKFFDTIAAFEIFDADGGMTLPGQTISAASSYEDLLGKTLTKVDSQNAFEGVVIGLGGGVRFRDPYTADVQILQGVVEVKPVRSLRESTLAGQAGALFVDPAGDAAGLLICGQSDLLFLAPLQPFLDAYGLGIMPQGNAVTFPAAEGELEAARAGAASMKREIASEPSMYQNHGGREVPARLLKLLVRK